MCYLCDRLVLVMPVTPLPLLRLPAGLVVVVVVPVVLLLPVDVTRHHHLPPDLPVHLRAQTGPEHWLLYRLLPVNISGLEPRSQLDQDVILQSIQSLQPWQLAVVKLSQL